MFTQPIHLDGNNLLFGSFEYIYTAEANSDEESDASNGDDSDDDNMATVKPVKQRKCSVCKKPGHTKATCKMTSTANKKVKGNGKTKQQNNFCRYRN